MELNREELSAKFDEANQTIGVLRFENNFLAKKTKMLEAKLFQVETQLQRTSSAKLDEMLSIQKSASDRTGLGCGLSSSNTELASENLDKGKSILGTPPKLENKDVKNPKAKKTNSQKPKQKKQHLSHHYGATGHTQPNC